MFTQQCFIRKSTKSLTDRLYRLGGRSGKGFWHLDYLTILAAYCDYFRCLDDERGNDKFLINCGFVDCGKNEELFLAIASLRDDSDIHQWFVHQDGSFLKCECDSKIDMWGDYEYPQEVYPRKATIEELIKHYGHESF